MNKFLSFCKIQLKYFFLNPFWTKWAVWAISAAALAGNGFVWYFYLAKFSNLIELTPVVYSSAVLGLNLFLADIIFPKEPLASYSLLGVAVLIQLLFLVFLRFFIVSQVF